MSPAAIEEYRRRRFFFPTTCFQEGACENKQTCRYVHDDDDEDIVEAAKRHPWNIESDARNAEHARKKGGKKPATKQQNSRRSQKHVTFVEQKPVEEAITSSRNTETQPLIMDNTPVPNVEQQYGPPHPFWPSPYPPDPRVWGGVQPQVIYNGMLYPMTTGWEMLGAHEAQYAQHYNSWLTQQHHMGIFQPLSEYVPMGQTYDYEQSQEQVPADQQHADTSENVRPCVFNDQHIEYSSQDSGENHHRQTNTKESPPPANQQYLPRQELNDIRNYGNTMGQYQNTMMQPFENAGQSYQHDYQYQNNNYDEQAYGQGDTETEYYQYRDQKNEEYYYSSEDDDTSTIRPSSRETTRRTPSPQKEEDNVQSGARSERGVDEIVATSSEDINECTSPKDGELVEVGLSMSDLQKSLAACQFMEVKVDRVITYRRSI